MRKKPLNLKYSIRDIPDFPKKGIIFKDITTLLGQGDLFHHAIDQIASYYQNKGIQKVIAIESRGFIMGAPLAYKLKAGFVPIRKKGKLPYKTVSATYQLEYGTDTLEIHEDALAPDEKVLIIDDLLATGGTIGAAIELVKKLGGKIAGLAFLIELGFLNGRKNLKNQDIFTLVKY
ncbi:MAG: adenine phosphoribosyltransferase [Endomicrobiales bacterium]|nr:adenine phosphoribosyltransferase [Endomicrobiales bacterium]